jgi:hypothetical protein
LLAANWHSTSGVWATGDYNYDGSVTISDLSLLAANWHDSITLTAALASLGYNSATGTFAAVPEPSTLAMLAGSLFGLLCYAWRKRK